MWLEHVFWILVNILFVYGVYNFYLFGIDEGFQKLFRRFNPKKKNGTNSGQKFG